jgi:predicted alpha/beta superfamily hydrolase
MKGTTMKNLCLSVLMGVVLYLMEFSSTVTAQGFPIIRDSLFSNALQEKRFLDIVLPDSSLQKPGEKYEVIYLLDGEWNINLVPFIHRFAAQEGFLPPAIFVGLPNTYLNGANQRDRDFLPVNAADKFLNFLRKEVIPYIEKKYPANGERTLFGHSYGGLFVGYTFLTDPQLFNAYLASDPAFQGSNGYVLSLAKEKLGKISGANKSFWINGIESTYKYMGIDVMDSIFQQQAPKDLHYKCSLFPNETHNSVRYKGVYDGLKFFYEGYSTAKITFHPMNGIALKNKPFKIYFWGNMNLRYTVDGTEPTSASAKPDSVLTLPGPAELKVRSLNVRGVNKVLTTGAFKEGKALKANSMPDNVKSGGLNYSYYRGEWDSLPNFNKLTPVSSGRMDTTFNLDRMPDQNNFGCVMEGFLEIKEEGYYIFILDSDDGTKFYINNDLLLVNDGLHAMGNTQTYMVPLQKGFYPVRLEYFQKGGGRGLDVRYVLPGREQPLPIPFEALYSK